MLSHQRNTKRNIQYDTNSNVQVTPGSNTGHANTSHQSAYAGRFISANVDVPKYQLPADEMSGQGAYQIIKDEMMLNSNPNMNLASFVTTWMEPEADQLFREYQNINLADQNVYPQCTELQHRCVNMLAHLYHARSPEKDAVGSATIGSSEGLMLGLLALLGKWRERERKRTGKDPLDEVGADGKIRKPNYIVSASSHVTVLKFGRYFNVETRVVPFEEGVRHLTPQEVIKRIDENTIGIVCVIGTQISGEVDDVKAIHNAVERHCLQEKKWDFVVPFHIDGASGGFIIPFVYPDFEFDFRLKHVNSIQISGHKYGLVYPGIGWIIWRSKDELPEDLVFHINYLGSDEPTFTLNFSRPATQIIGQYYNFLRLGFAGYKRISTQTHNNAKYTQEQLDKLGYFDFLSDLNKPSIPVVAFKFKAKYAGLDPTDLVNGVKTAGWTLPQYTLPPNCQEQTVFRITCRESFTRDLADYLCSDIKRTVSEMIAKLQKYNIPLDKAVFSKQDSTASVESGGKPASHPGHDAHHVDQVTKHGKSSGTRHRGHRNTEAPVHMGIC